VCYSQTRGASMGQDLISGTEKHAIADSVARMRARRRSVAATEATIEMSLRQIAESQNMLGQPARTGWAPVSTVNESPAAFAVSPTLRSEQDSACCNE
jgi:hypothetical protein